MEIHFMYFREAIMKTGFFFPVSSGTLISVAVGTDPEKANAD